jgi:hypothetical protein
MATYQNSRYLSGDKNRLDIFYIKKNKEKFINSVIKIYELEDDDFLTEDTMEAILRDMKINLVIKD